MMSIRARETGNKSPDLCTEGKRDLETRVRISARRAKETWKQESGSLHGGQKRLGNKSPDLCTEGKRDLETVVWISARKQKRLGNNSLDDDNEGSGTAVGKCCHAALGRGSGVRLRSKGFTRRLDLCWNWI
jgi:hypothetical protein